MDHEFIKAILLCALVLVMCKSLIVGQQSYHCPTCGSGNGDHAPECPWRDQ